MRGNTPQITQPIFQKWCYNDKIWSTYFCVKFMRISEKNFALAYSHKAWGGFKVWKLFLNIAFLCRFWQLWNLVCRYMFNRLIFWQVSRFDFLPGGGGMPENATIVFYKFLSHCWKWLQTFFAFNHLETKRNFCDCVNANDMGGV